MKAERRSLALPAEIRSEGDTLTMRGYAYRFNELSHDLGGFRERILPGAGRASLERNDVYATFNHDANNALGRRAAGTLRVGEDELGGWYEIDLPDTTVGRDVAALLRRGDVRGSSFSFRVNEGGQRRGKDDAATGLPVREITSMDVLELGPVLNPAYPATDAALRSVVLSLGNEEPPEREPSGEPESVRNTRALVSALFHVGGNK